MKEVDRYIAEMPKGRRGKAVFFHGLITALFPQAVVSLNRKMPTYNVGDHFIAWGDKKSYFSIYTCSTERIAVFKKKNPAILSRVGCLNFRDRDNFPLADLKTVIVNALDPGPAILKRERRAVSSSQRTKTRR